MSTAFHAEVSNEAEFVSPELALVDPALAAAARERLPEPGDALSSGPMFVWTPPPTAYATVPSAPAEFDLVVSEKEPASSVSRVRTRDGRLRARRFRPPASTVRLVAAAGLISVVIAALLADAVFGPEPGVPNPIVEEPMLARSASESDPDGSVATRPSPRPEQPVGTKSAAQGPEKPTKAPRRPAAASARRFAWAPVAGASGYLVEFYRGSERVLAADTTRPQLTVPATWESGGSLRRLEPGDYRWYVWPIVDGKRAPSAVVQATLNVP